MSSYIYEFPKGNQPLIFIDGTDAEAWSSSILATWWEELTYQKRPWCWERLKAGGEGDDRGQDSWMASLTQWTQIWASSRRWWKTGKPGMLQSMGSQRIRHDWASEQQYMNRSMCPTLFRIWISNHHFKKDFRVFSYIPNIILVNMLYMG